MAFQHLSLFRCCLLLVRFAFLMTFWIVFALQGRISVRISCRTTGLRLRCLTLLKSYFVFLKPWSQTAYSKTILNSINRSKCLVISLWLAEFVFASYANETAIIEAIFILRIRNILILKDFLKFSCTSSRKLGRGTADFNKKQCASL